MNLFDLIDAPPQVVVGSPITETTEFVGEPKTFARLILAGGKGSRLGLGPKALVDIEGRRLLDFFLEGSAQTYVMCNGESIDEIQRAAPRAYCFSQDTLPLLDGDGSVCGQAPCGNGDALLALDRSGLLEQIDAERLIVYPIDNPLGLAAEPLLACAEGDVAIAAARAIEGEPSGGLVEVDGKVRVVEYLHSAQRVEWINTGIYSLSLDFVRRICKEPLPIHPVKKEGMWKFEKFLFDTFAFARTSQAIGFERKEIFAPIKSPADLKEFATALHLQRVSQSVTIK